MRKPPGYADFQILYTFSWSTFTTIDGPYSPLVIIGSTMYGGNPGEYSRTWRTCTALMDNGIDVYVVSASPEDIIAPRACNSEYGYRIPRENVHGVKFTKNNSVLQPELSVGRPMTWGPGKVELIRKQFAASKGYSPILICGDSDGDHNMLSEFPETKPALIVNRLKKGNIGGLCELACKQLLDSNPRYILQGIDENTGLFSPGEATIKFGTTEKQTMK